MYEQVEKSKENKSQNLTNDLSQKLSTGESTFQFVDNRPEAVAQRNLQDMENNSSQVKQLRAIQEMAKNSLQTKKAAQLQAMERNITPETTQRKEIPEAKEASPSTIQMKIHVKSGEKYGRVKSTTTAPKLTAITTSPNIYYVKSLADIQKMKNQEDVPVLANKKHLIGERHNASRFTDAVEDWGWAAGMLIEEYSEHKKLKSPLQQEKERSPVTEGIYDQNFIWAKAKALENMAAKGLTGAVNAQIFGQKILNIARRIQNPQTFAMTDKKILKDTCKLAWGKCNPVMDITRSLVTYYRESSESIFGFKKHDLLRQTLTQTLITEIGAGLDNIKAQYDDKNNVHLDPVVIQSLLNHVNALVPVMQQLVVAYDSKDFSLEQIQTMSADALVGGQNQNGDIGTLDPLREKYMRKNIEGAKVPTLVKIGKQHVGHFAGNLPANTIGYDDYINFKQKNTAENVDS